MTQRKRLYKGMDNDIDERERQPNDPESKLSSKDDEKQLLQSDESNKECDVRLSKIHKEFQCPICLGIIKKAKIVKQCKHRFCKECIEKAFRLSNHECPICRVHCASRRALMDDLKFDSKIVSLFPCLEKYDQEEMTLNGINMEIEKAKQKAYKAILEKQNVASMSTKNSGVKEIIESSRRSEAEQQIPQDNVLASPNNLMDFIRSSSSLVWERSGQRSNNRTIVNNPTANGSNRISRLIEHLRNLSQENKDELDVFVKFLSFEEKRVPNLRVPYLLCKPTMSISQLREYVALETSLQIEEVELYVIKECQPNIILEDAKLDSGDIKSELLTREEETLGRLIPENLNRGHLVIAYKKKMWDLNMALC